MTKTKTITVRTQKQLDSLPKAFKDSTTINVISDKTVYFNGSISNAKIVFGGKTKAHVSGSSTSVYVTDQAEITISNGSVKAYGSAKVTALGSSRVFAYQKSNLSLFQFAEAVVCSSTVKVNNALDYSMVLFRGCPIKVLKKSKTSTQKHIPNEWSISFKEWLSRGYVNFNGLQKINFKKQSKNLYLVGFGNKEKRFLVTDGNSVFSVNKTKKAALKFLKKGVK